MMEKRPPCALELHATSLAPRGMHSSSRPRDRGLVTPIQFSKRIEEPYQPLQVEDVGIFFDKIHDMEGQDKMLIIIFRYFFKKIINFYKWSSCAGIKIASR